MEIFTVNLSKSRFPKEVHERDARYRLLKEFLNREDFKKSDVVVINGKTFKLGDKEHAIDPTRRTFIDEDCFVKILRKNKEIASIIILKDIQIFQYVGEFTKRKIKKA